MLRAAFRGKHTNSSKVSKGTEKLPSRAENELDPNSNGVSCIHYSKEQGDKDEVLGFEGNQIAAAELELENPESERSAPSDLANKHESSQDSGDDSDKNIEPPSTTTGSGKRYDNFDSERAIYEMQLVKLQEELVTAMIENQVIGEQLAKLKAVNVENLVKELEGEKKKSKELGDKLRKRDKAVTPKLSRRTATRADPRSIPAGIKCSSCHKHLDPEDSERNNEEWVDLGQDLLVAGRPSRTDVTNGIQSSTSVRENETAAAVHVESVLEKRAAETQEVARPPTKFEKFKNSAVNVIVDRLYDFLNEEADDTTEEDGDGEPLAVKTLKENINRFSNGIRPITNFVKSVSALISWKNPTATLLTFVVYMYAVWYGVLLPLILFLIIWKLSINYLYSRGIATQLGFPKKVKEEPPQADDKTWSDKFQLVLQVARKVQNILGNMADSLEKLKNLFMWQHAEGSRRLFTMVLMAFFASLLFSGPTLFRLGALGFGVKMFIVRSIYNRFPKVKKRYDSTARLWEELPTDTEIALRDENISSDETPETLSRTLSTCSRQHLNHNGSHNDHSHGLPFHERMQLPVDERPLPEWEEGRRCTLMNKDRPLHNMKHGRLYLTQSYICFERSKLNPFKNIAIKLENITQLTKYKPLTLLPGSGMALEIHLRYKSFVFGAIIGRDEVYDMLHSAGRAANLPWAGASRIEEGLVRMGALAASSSRLHET